MAKRPIGPESAGEQARLNWLKNWRAETEKTISDLRGEDTGKLREAVSEFESHMDKVQGGSLGLLDWFYIHTAYIWYLVLRVELARRF